MNNRPLSMTSFGRGEHGDQERKWTVELRAVNHRFLDVKIKMAREYGGLEDRIKKMISSSMSRGHVDVIVTASGSQAGNLDLQVNVPLARKYFRALLEVRNELRLPEAPSLELVAANRDIITATEMPEDLDVIWASLRQALAQALEASQAMRLEEGRALKEDLLCRLGDFAETVDKIETRIPELAQQRKTILQERLEKLLGEVELDPMRLAQEVSIMADKADVTEEVVRLNSHIEQFKGFMDLDEPVGRRLDFLLQEFLREINTLGSKISDATVTHMIVDLKNETEKMREQVQNLE